MSLFVLFCDAPCLRSRAAITAVAMFIAARIRTSCSVKPRVAIFPITASERDSKRRISNQGNFCTKRGTAIPPNKMSLLVQAFLSQHCRKLKLSRADQHWSACRQELVLLEGAATPSVAFWVFRWRYEAMTPQISQAADNHIESELNRLTYSGYLP